MKVSLVNLRLKDLLGPVTRVKKKKKKHWSRLSVGLGLRGLSPPKRGLIRGLGLGGWIEGFGLRGLGCGVWVEGFGLRGLG